jgi:nitrous-oxide reductase
MPKNTPKPAKAKNRKCAMPTTSTTKKRTPALTMGNETIVLDPKELPDIVYFMPCPKSPHGCDVDPTGEYIVRFGQTGRRDSGVFVRPKCRRPSPTKVSKANLTAFPVLKYDAVLHGEVKKPGLGPLHTEFDGKGFAYTSLFVSSEIVKWNIETLEVVDRVPTYYSIGHLWFPAALPQTARQIRHRLQQDHQGPLPAHRPGTDPVRSVV